VVAGNLYSGNITKMFNMYELAQDTETMTVESMHHTISSALLKAQEFVRTWAITMNVRCMDVIEEIICSGGHPLYMTLTNLVANYMRAAACMNIDKPPNDREVRNMSYLAGKAEIEFMIKWKAYMGHT